MKLSSLTTLPRDNSSGISNDRPAHGSTPPLRRAYRFTVITLSVLLLAMAIWRPSPSGHVAQVLLRHQETDPAHLADHGLLESEDAIVDGRSHAHQWFRSSDHLRRMAMEGTRSPNSPLAEETTQQRAAWSDEWVARLSYRVEADDQGGTQIAVRAIDTDPARGVWALQSLADQFIAAHIATGHAADIIERIGKLNREIQETTEQIQVGAHSESAAQLVELQRARDQLPSREMLLRGSVSVEARTETIQSLNGRYRPLPFFGLVLLSTVVGGVFALWPTRTRQPAVMYSVQDTVETLGLPVIGAVSRPGGRIVPEPEAGCPAPATWTATRLSESVLVGVLWLMLLFLIGDRGFGGQLVEDPLAAYTAAVDRVIHWLI